MKPQNLGLSHSALSHKDPGKEAIAVLVGLLDQLGEGCVSEFIEDVEIGTTETVVAHGLFKTSSRRIVDPRKGPRPERGPRWRVLSKRGPGDVYETRRSDLRFLYLVASAPVVCTIEVL